MGFKKGLPKSVLSCILGVFLTSPLSSTPLPPTPELDLVKKLNGNSDFEHAQGRPGAKGWELDHRKHRAGYALSGLNQPLFLDPGAYRCRYIIRKGNYPNKGLLHKNFGLFRLEVWDVESKTTLASRELQVSDFSHPNHYEPRWVEFSIPGPKGRFIEPRAYWLGLANGEIDSVAIERFPKADLRSLRDKAIRIGDQLDRAHLENGFTVSRKPNGDPDEIGDATTYTSLYVASLAWAYAQTQERKTYERLQNAIQTLHRAIQETEDGAIPVRFIDQEGNTYPQAPSKDVYTFLYLAYAAAYPVIKNEALKEQIREDVEKLTYKFMDDDLRIKAGGKTILRLTPYFTEDEIRHGIHKLITKEKKYRTVLDALKKARLYMPIAELWPGMKKVTKALKTKDESLILAMVLPTLNGVTGLVERGRQLLKERYREDLFPRRKHNKNTPGIKLEKLLADSLKKLPERKRGDRFENLSDFRVLASNAILSLHIIKTAEVITKNVQFEEYYRSNLYTQEALLKTAVEWFGVEEDFIALTSGNPAADRHRRGYLSALALVNLIQLETNTANKNTYKELLNRWLVANRNEDNPLVHAIKDSYDVRRTTHEERINYLVLKGLDLYPENRVGFGRAYWKKNGKKIGLTLGGGVKKGYSREPLPISHRPKGSFLWQRNARRLKGDRKNTYPGTDYLFLYWFARHHNLIPSDGKSNTTPAQAQALEP